MDAEASRADERYQLEREQERWSEALTQQSSDEEGCGPVIWAVWHAGQEAAQTETALALATAFHEALAEAEEKLAQIRALVM